MGRREDLKQRFKDRIDKREIKTPTDFHEVFDYMTDLEIGEEIKDDVWTIIKIPGGWIVRRLNFGTVFVPETV